MASAFKLIIIRLIRRLYGYTTRHRAKLYRIGGMPDHVHILVSLPPDLAVSEFVRGLKYATNGWMKHNPLFPLFAGWGEGYAAFTYSKEQIPVVKQYIINQKEHHRQTSFAEVARVWPMPLLRLPT